MKNVILKKNKEVRNVDTLELIGHWFKQDNIVYAIKNSYRKY